jgi:hypothetical protein
VTNINQRIQILKQKSKVFLKNFNVFPSVAPSIDEHQLHQERISTRLFIFLLISSFGILLLYTSLIDVTQTVNVKAPTITQYSQLYSTYSQTLTCPCSKISINYQTFIQINYTLHQLCNSIFVTQYWIDYLANSRGNTITFIDDFRATGTFTFQALNAFCELINQTIVNRLIQFNSTQYVSASVTSFQLFQSQTQSFISQFKSTMTNDFLLSLSTIRNTTQSNALLSGQLTNYLIETPRGETDAYTTSRFYGNCSCAFSAMCGYQSRFYVYPAGTVLFVVPGIYTGCYVIESLLQSNLQCFYNQTCINTLQSYFVSSSSMNITALDISLSSRYSENSTIEDLVDELMIEEWNSSIIYENYFNECEPTECTYTHQTKNSIIYIVTTIIGLIGGLTTALKLIVPRLVKIIALCIQKLQVRHTAVMPFIQT